MLSEVYLNGEKSEFLVDLRPGPLLMDTDEYWNYDQSLFEGALVHVDGESWVTIDSHGKLQYGNSGGYAGECDSVILAKQHCLALKLA